jgi:DNA polymerase III delta prime subunit
MIELVGHEEQRERLRAAVARDRVAGAYLFAGPEGVGKGLCALEFARILNCESGVGEPECGCASCRLVVPPSGGRGHPEIVFFRDATRPLPLERARILEDPEVFPDGLSRAGRLQRYREWLEVLVDQKILARPPVLGDGEQPVDFLELNTQKLFDREGLLAGAARGSLLDRLEAIDSGLGALGRLLFAALGGAPYAGTIKIQTIRTHLQAGLEYAPFAGRRKVFIIDNAHRMTRQAANALLKTLEEPPRHATIVLVTDRRVELLPTILSRCQQMVFAPLSADRVAQVLARRTAYSEAMQQQISRVCGGQVALALARDWRTFFETWRRRWEQLVALSHRELEPLFRLAAALAPPELDVSERRAAFLESLGALDLLVRDMAVREAATTERCLLEMFRNGGHPAPWDLDGLAAISEMIAVARRRVYGNVEPLLLAEALLLRWARLPRREGR